MMKRKGIVIGLVAFAVLYCGVYVALRSEHVIMHFSNADHWHPEKRSPGHFVDTRSDKTISDKIVKVIFFPAMLAERTFRNIMN